MKALDEILVIIPTGGNGQLESVAVCSVGDLMRELESADDLEEAIEGASIDAPMSFSTEKQLKEIDRILFKIRKSNAAPDFCYWEPET